MAEIKLSPLAATKLDELIDTLYEDEYFGFFESSLEYVQNLRNFIFSIDTLKIKNTSINKYGNFYCKYKHNNKTTWYVLFDKINDNYLVNNITNNHSPDYPLLFP
jgi:hypothetical protein